MEPETTVRSSLRQADIYVIGFFANRPLTDRAVRTRCRFAVRLCCRIVTAVVVALLAVGVTSAHATQYRITELGPVPGGIYSLATAINDAGIATGYAPIDNRGNVGSALPVHWNSQGAGQLVWTPSDVERDYFDPPRHIPAAPGGIPMAINNLGQVVGRSNYGHFTPLPSPGIGEGRAFVWFPGQETPLDITPADAGRGEARGINDAGQVVGGYLDSSNSSNVGFIWDSVLGIRPLGFLAGGNSTRPAAINNAGTVVGTATRADGRPQAFIWNAVDGIQPLGTVANGAPGTSALAINNLGQVIGGGNGLGTTYLWDSVDGFTNLIDPIKGFNLFLTLGGINDRTQIVGSAIYDGIENAIIWENSLGRLRLDSLTVDSTGWHLERATGINNFGQIIGVGQFNGERRGFLLTPVPEPASLFLMFCATLCVLLFQRRR